MLINIQYPIINFNNFIDNEDQKMFFNPILQVQPGNYLKNFGKKIERAHKDGIYVNAYRAMRYNANPCRCSIEVIDTKIIPKGKYRFFSIHEVVSYFSIGIKFVSHKMNCIILGNIKDFLTEVLNIEMVIPKGNIKQKRDGNIGLIKTKLKQAGEILKPLYFYTTTRKDYLAGINVQNISTYTPLIILKYDKIKNIPNNFRKVQIGNGLCVHYKKIKISGKKSDDDKYFFLWMIRNDKSRKKRINDLCICISRMHREVEGAIKVANHLVHARNQNDLNFDKILFFLKNSIEWLQQKKLYNYNIKNLIFSAYGINIDANSKEYKELMKNLNSKTENIQNKNRFMLEISKGVNNVLEGKITIISIIKKVVFFILLFILVTPIVAVIMYLVILNIFPQEQNPNAVKDILAIIGGIGGLITVAITTAKFLLEMKQKHNEKDK
ncbi:MAG: hypothetical protein FWD47_13000 [Treponema sp.]|nr:hypothetical protein [Treponema sp.]